MNLVSAITWFCSGILFLGIINTICAYIERYKEQKIKKFNNALHRLQTTTFEFEGKHICFWQAIPELSAEDAVKVFLLYEKLRWNTYYMKYKDLNTTINSLTKEK